MTTMRIEDIRCFMCGAVRKYQVLSSTNAFGSMDLDTRPPEMKRSTMHTWIQVCPECGYTATDVSDETTVGREFLESKAYRTCSGIPFASDLAKAFYRRFLIQEAEGNGKNAFIALLNASWACDDAEDSKGAEQVRNLAAEITDRMLMSGEVEWTDPQCLIRADMLRRASRFDELLEQYDPERYEDGLLKSIAAFERELAGRKDTGCHTVQEAVDFAEKQDGSD